MPQLLTWIALLVPMLITVGSVSADITDDLVVYFTFDKVKGKRVLDASGNGLDAEVVKNTKFVKGKYGSAVYIRNKTEDCVNVPAVDMLKISGEITMMAWLYQKDWLRSSAQWLDKGCYSEKKGSYGMAVFAKKDFPELKLRENDSGIAMIIAGRNWQRRNIVHYKVESGKWYHITGTHAAENLKIYLDGEVIGEFDSEFDFAGTNDEDLRIGCAKGKFGHAFEGGFIDEVALWSRALSETEIRTAMRGTLLSVSPKDKVATTWGNIKRKAF